MRPTNHLRWKEYYRTVSANPGMYGDWWTRQEEYQQLEQFWEDETMFDTMKKEVPSWDAVANAFGEWRPIRVEGADNE